MSKRNLTKPVIPEAVETSQAPADETPEAPDPLTEDDDAEKTTTDTPPPDSTVDEEPAQPDAMANEPVSQPDLVDDIRFVGEKYTAVFSNRGAILRTLYLNGFKHVVDEPGAYRLIHDSFDDDQEITFPAFALLPYRLKAEKDLETLHADLNTMHWEVVGPVKDDKGRTVITFFTTFKDLKFTKIFTLDATSSMIGFRQEITNLATVSQKVGYRVYPTASLHKAEEDKMDYRAMFGRANAESHEDYDVGKLRKANKDMPASLQKKDYFIEDYQVQWAGCHNLYFAALLQVMPESKHQATIAAAGMSYPNPGGPVTQERMNPFLGTAPEAIEPSDSLIHEYQMFVGPRLDGNLYGYYGIEKMKSMWLFRPFDYVAGPASAVLTSLLRWIRAIVRNYGVAIICLTLIVRSLMHPLSKKQYNSMRAMGLLSPRMQAMKAKHKNDKQKFNQEVMKMYQDFGINPLGGCLPMLVQMPIFLGLWRGIRYTLELRHSSFLWIKDLARPDHMFDLPFSLPFLGSEFNLLPLCFIISMVIQMRLQPKSEDPQQRQQQQMMSMIMPIMFLAIFYRLPSGLTLYFLASNLYGIAEAKLNKRTFDKSEIAKKIAAA